MSEPTTPIFEQAVAELEKILRELEDGNTSLEESMTKYERGVYLIKSCYGQLQSAEDRITQLMGLDENGKPRIGSFSHSSSAEKTVTETKRRTTRKAE